MNAKQKIILLWLFWAIILIGFQATAQARFDPKRPDKVLQWTTDETARVFKKDQPYLLFFHE
jgi:hypothetical protein